MKVQELTETVFSSFSLPEKVNIKSSGRPMPVLNITQWEENNEEDLRTLRQEVHQLRERLILLEAENTNLKSKIESNECSHAESRGAQSLPVQKSTSSNQNTHKPLQAAPGERKKYKKSAGAANMAGELYEVAMASLIYIRCQARGMDFLLATNVAAALPLDDVVLSLQDKTVFVQLKHYLAKDKTIYDSMFIQLVSDFSLMKYFKAYLNIKKNWKKDLKCCGDFKNAVFVLYTNAHMAKQKTEESVDSDGWQSIISTGGNFVHVSRETHPHFYQLFESLPRDRELLLNSKEGENEEELLDVVRRLQNNVAKTPPDSTACDKMLKEMVSMDDLPEYEDFLSHLWIFTSQMKYQNVNSCIKKELQALWGTKTDNITVHFNLRMQEWWREDRYFLNGNTDFWNEMVTSLAESISQEKVKEVAGLGIRFDKQELNKISALIDSCKDVTRIVAVNSVKMTTLKVHQALGRCILLDVSTLQERTTEVMLLWRWCPVLVVVMDGEGNPPQSVSGRKLVIISKDVNSETSDCMDNFTIEQLDGYSRAQVLSLSVTFQGAETTLWELLGTDSKLNVTINGNLIIDMLRGNRPCLGNELPSLPEYYIPRTLIHCCTIKRNILTARVNTTIAISGIEESEVIQIKPAEESMAEVTIVIIQDEDDFNRIKSQYNSVHWLEYKNEILYWRKSHGDISFIREFLEEESSFRYNNVSTVDDIEDNVVILSAEPGMGKSTLLTNIAINTKSSIDSALVLRVNLLDCISELQKLPMRLSINNVHSFLLNVSHTLDMEGVFAMRLMYLGCVCLFFDGYDEISPDYSDKVSQMLNLLKESNPRKLFVTTRPEMRQVLEESLSTLAYTLQPFSEQDQESLLKKWWGCLSKECEPEVLEWFVHSIIAKFSESINEKNFLAIPLQTMILAEIFADNFVTLATTGEFSMPESLDPLYIFEQFVDRKFNIYWHKNGTDLSIPSSKENYKGVKKDFIENHMLCAVIVVCPFIELKGHSLTRLEQLIKRIVEGREKTGIIMNVVNGIPVFVHRMFAEYFCALWFAENYKQYKSSMQMIHWDSSYHVVLDFFNRVLSKSCKLHTAVLNMDTSAVLSKVTEQPDLVNTVDKGGRLPLHLAILNCKDSSEDSQASVIVKILLSVDAIELKCEHVLGKSPIEYAEKLKISWITNILEARAQKVIQKVPQNLVNVLQPVRSVVPSEIRGVFDLLEWLNDKINEL